MVKTVFTVLFFLCISGHIHAQETIHSTSTPEINGIKQFIEIDTEDTTKPILLFLHGGPGFSSRTYLKPIKKKLEKDFILVQWDQRETGNTLAMNASGEPLTPELFHKDSEEIVAYLLERFDRKKLILVGFSWGGYLGMTYAKNHPENLLAYVSVSSIIDPLSSEKLTLETIRSKAKEENNDVAVAELKQVTIPFENWEQLYFQRKWTAYYSGVKVNSRTYPRWLFENWSKTWFDLFVEASEVNYIESAPKIDCPVYFFLAHKDLVSNYQITERYYYLLEAPVKEIIWFEKSTHEIPNQEPKKFVEELVNISEGTMP